HVQLLIVYETFKMVIEEISKHTDIPPFCNWLVIIHTQSYVNTIGDILLCLEGCMRGIILFQDIIDDIISVGVIDGNIQLPFIIITKFNIIAGLWFQVGISLL